MGLSTVSAFKNMQNENKELKKLNDKQLKQLQNILLEILEDIDYFCKKNDITYTLGGGSCLGAIRHNGIIPWDDDIDLNMPRKDYDKFRKLFLSEMGEKYWLHTPEDKKDYGLGFSRVRKKNTIYKSREDKNNDECGIYVDIFIIENTYNFFLMRLLHGFLSLTMGFILSCKNFYINKNEYMDLVKNNKNMKKIFRLKCFVGFVFSCFSVDSLTHGWNNINRMCKNNNSKYVTIPVGRQHFFKETYLRKDVCLSENHEFNNKNIPVCVGYDTYLKNLYNNYMEIPPIEKHETHIFYDIKF